MALELSEHPDRRDNEVYFMDCCPKIWDDIKWSTKRQGPGFGDGTFPVFVERWEVDLVGFTFITAPQAGRAAA